MCQYELPEAVRAGILAMIATRACLVRMKVLLETETLADSLVALKD